MADDSLILLVGKISGLVEGMNERLARADESRGRTHERLDKLALAVDQLTDELRLVRKDMDDMKPEVELVKGLRAKAAGAVVVLGAIGALLGWAAGAFYAPVKALILRAF